MEVWRGKVGGVWDTVGGEEGREENCEVDGGGWGGVEGWHVWRRVGDRNRCGGRK